MKRIILHWTAGTHTVSALDKRHYHVIIDGAGNVHRGDNPISANRAPIGKNYAAHTLNCNTDSIGVAVAAMANAKQAPFRAGNFPITPHQYEKLIDVVADLAREYGIPVTPETILSHAEVQPTLGIKQRGKWDICWLPGMDAPSDPVAVGDMIRDRVKQKLRPASNHVTKPKDNWFMSFLKAIFGGKR